jgi:hypothetical protein
MPKDPKGRKRPADVISNAVHVMRIGTREAEDAPRSAAPIPKQLDPAKGGKLRASPERRRAIARTAAKAR